MKVEEKRVETAKVFVCDTCDNRCSQEKYISICPICGKTEVCGKCGVFLYDVLEKVGFTTKVIHLVLNEVEAAGIPGHPRYCRNCVKVLLEYSEERVRDVAKCLAVLMKNIKEENK